MVRALQGCRSPRINSTTRSAITVPRPGWRSIMPSAIKPSRAANQFDLEYDVVVVGYGYAGGISSIVAADNGAKVLLIEKSAVPGGISICSYGALRCANDPELAFQYLKETNAGRTPDDVIRALAEGMCEMEDYVRGLAKVSGALVTTTEEYG